MNDRFDVLEADVAIERGRITAIGPNPAGAYARTMDAHGAWILPGFIQTHVHLCQTLFRGYADDLPLMEWLRRRVWPMEAAHTPETLRAAARLAAVDLLRTGTTSVLTMETVHDTDAVFEAVAETGLRATIGKCMMDGEDAGPGRLRESRQASIDESLALWKRWDGAANGRIRAAFAPRFAVACSRELLEAVAHLSREHGALVHTHASESREELEIVRQRTRGLTNVAYLREVGLASSRLCAAHCVWVDEHEQQLIGEHDVKVLHCPGSNLKLGSGIAPIVELRARGVTVSLGADGAACNNRLDMFDELRLAAALQAVRRRPGALSAREAVWMATRGGARTLGLEQELGSIEVGKRADLIVVDRDAVHLTPSPDVYSTLVYAARGTDVRITIVDGQVLVHEGLPVHLDQEAIVADARRAAARLAAAAG
jgi:5-methylthioadenosine/S-adenosylhomocysteine deaminase